MQKIQFDANATRPGFLNNGLAALLLRNPEIKNYRQPQNQNQIIVGNDTRMIGVAAVSSFLAKQQDFDPTDLKSLNDYFDMRSPVPRDPKDFQKALRIYAEKLVGGNASININGDEYNLAQLDEEQWDENVAKIIQGDLTHYVKFLANKIQS